MIILVRVYLTIVGVMNGTMPEFPKTSVFLILRSIYSGCGELEWSILVGEWVGQGNWSGSDWEIINDGVSDNSSYKAFMAWYGKWAKGQNVLEWVTNYTRENFARVEVRGFWIMGGSLKSLEWSFEDLQEASGWKFRWLPVDFVKLCKNMRNNDDYSGVVESALKRVKEKVSLMVKSDFMLNFAIKEGLVVRKGFGDLVSKDLGNGLA